MIKKIKKFFIENKIYIIFSLIIGIFIFKYQYSLADDIKYKTMLERLGRIGFIKSEYFHWSGRLSVFIVKSIFKYNLVAWKIENVILSFLFLKGLSYYYIPFLKRKHKREMDKILLTVMFLIFPYTITSTFVWMTGNYHYIWPITGFIYAMIPYYYNLFVSDKYKFSKVQWLTFYLSTFMAAYVEQTFFAMFVISSIALVIIFQNKEIKNRKYFITYYIFFIINAIISRLTPGFKERMGTEFIWYQNYENMPFGYRVYEVINLVNKHIIAGSNLLFFVLVILLSLVIYRRYKMRFKILYIPFFYMILNLFPVNLIDNNVMLWYFNFDNIFNPFRTKQTLFIRSGLEKILFDVMYPIREIKISRVGYLPSILTYTIIIFASCVILISFKDIKRGVLNFGIYWTALGTVYIMCISPTIYASGSRIFLLMNVMFIFIISQLYIELNQEYKIEQSKEFRIGKTVFFCISALILFSYTTYLLQSVSN